MEETVSPNPCQDFIEIKLTESTTQSSIELVNLQGQQIKKLIADGETLKLRIDLLDVNPGVYYLLVKSQETHQTIQKEKIIKL